VFYLFQQAVLKDPKTNKKAHKESIQMAREAGAIQTAAPAILNGCGAKNLRQRETF